MTKRVSYTRGVAFPCPCCDESTRIRDSFTESPTVRSVKYQCNNVNCGHTFEAHLTFVRTITPSAIGPIRQITPFLRLTERKGPLSPSGPIGGFLPAQSDQAEPPPKHP